MSDYRKTDIDFKYSISRAPKGSASPIRFNFNNGVWNNQNKEPGHAVIMCAGDLMCEPVMSEACFYDDSYDFRACFRYLRQVLSQSDLAMANLETIISDSIPYAREIHRVDHHTGVRYHCNAPAEYLDGLRYAGFDAMVLANNHDADGGYQGIIDTLDNLDERSFMHTGMFRDDTESRVLMTDINGIRLAVLSYTEHINRNLDTEILTEEGCKVMMNRYDSEKLAKDIAQAREEGAEFILVYIHLLGTEYSSKILDRQRRTVKEIAEAGADCIMGSHMHCIQQYDQIETSDGRTVPVVYSLGNLISSDRTGYMTKRSIIYKLELRRKDGKVEIEEESYIPCRTVEGTEASAFVVFPAQPRYRNDKGSEFFLNACDNIGEEIGHKIAQDHIKHSEDLVPGDFDFDILRGLNVGKICKIIGVDPNTIRQSLREYETDFVTARYFEVKENCFFFSRRTDSSEEQEARSAFERGAKVLFTSKQFVDPKGKKIPSVIVSNPSEKYQKLCSWIKGIYDVKTLAITGSVGKTTAKDMIASALDKKFDLLKSSADINEYHDIGEEIQKLTPENELYIQEVNASTPGRIEACGRMINCDMCLITNIGYQHTDKYNSIADIFNEKTSLISNLPENGVAFLNYDDSKLAAYETDKKVISFAINNDADYMAKNVQVKDNKAEFDIVDQEGTYHAEIQVPGTHNIYNALAAFAIGRYLGLEPESIIGSLSQFRGEGIHQGLMNIGGYKLYLDCASADIISLPTTIKALAAMDISENNKKIAVIGDVSYLGSRASEFYKNIAISIKDEKIDTWLIFGEKVYELSEALKDYGKNVSYFNDRDKLNAKLSEIVKRGDIILFTGGRNADMGKTVDNVFGTSFHITRKSVVLNRSQVLASDYYYVRKIDGITEIRGAKTRMQNRKIPGSFDSQSSVKRIGDNSFLGGLVTNLMLPDSLVNIGKYAFSNCGSLERIKMGSGLKVIEEGAFSNCTKLQEVMFNDGLTDVGEKAFANSALREAYIPDSVGHIADNAFENCLDLTIHCKAGSYAEEFALKNNYPVSYTILKSLPVPSSHSDMIPQISIKEVCQVLDLPVPEKDKIKYDINRLRNVSCTSWSLKSGDIAIVTRGKLTLIDAVNRRPAIIISPDEVSSSVYSIKLPETLTSREAYVRICNYIRSKHNIPSVAVTGNAGKTTTKDLIGRVLSSQYNTLYVNKNYNTWFTAGEILQNLSPDHELYLQEIHEPHASDCSYEVLPEAVIITNLERAHLDETEEVSLESSIRSTLKVLDHAKPGATVFANNECKYLSKEEFPGFKVIRYSAEHIANSDYWAENVRNDIDSITFDVCSKNEEPFEMKVNVSGMHNVINAVGAFAVGRFYGVPKEKIREAILSYRPSGIRQNLMKLDDRYVLVDCYSITVLSAAVSVRTICDLPLKPNGRRIMVIGYLPTLASGSEEAHRDLAREICKYPLDLVIGYRNDSKYIVDECQKSGMNAVFFQYHKDVIEFLKKNLTKDDNILFKAGTAAHLEHVANTVLGINVKAETTMDSDRGRNGGEY